MAFKINPAQGTLKWNAKAARYVGKDGRFLSPFQIRQIIDSDIDAAEARLKAAFRRLQSGEVNLEMWRAIAAREIKFLHAANCAAAVGGYRNLSESDIAAINARVKRQYVYLDRFARQLEANNALIYSLGSSYRASLYARAGRVTFELARGKNEERRGAKWARRIKHSSESCKGCAPLFGKWLPIAEMPAIGTLTCNIHCKCTIDYAYSDDKPFIDAPTPTPPVEVNESGRKQRVLKE